MNPLLPKLSLVSIWNSASLSSRLAAHTVHIQWRTAETGEWRYLPLHPWCWSWVGPFNLESVNSRTWFDGWLDCFLLPSIHPPLLISLFLLWVRKTHPNTAAPTRAWCCNPPPALSQSWTRASVCPEDSWKCPDLIWEPFHGVRLSEPRVLPQHYLLGLLYSFLLQLLLFSCQSPDLIVSFSFVFYLCFPLQLSERVQLYLSFPTLFLLLCPPFKKKKHLIRFIQNILAK